MRSVMIALLMAVTAHAAPSSGRLPAFELGKKNYETGNYVRALDLFAQAIASSSDASSRNRAYYFQGLTLFELGHYYSSYVSFRNVLLTADDKNREIYDKAIRNAVTIADKLDMVERIGKLLDKLPSHFIPQSVGAYANYAMGVSRLESGDLSSSSAAFKGVHPESQFYPRSLFFLGVVATRQKNYRDAAVYFDKVVDVSRGKKELFPVAELARLNLARTVYTTGDLERSIELYAQFLSTSPHWLTILLEAAWPLMRVNDTTVSLGNLHTVLSPFYREELVGEGYILRATILYSLCKYEEMRRTLSQFFTIYDPVLRSMQAEQGKMQGADSYFQALQTDRGMNRSFLSFIKRDSGIKKQMRVLEILRDERRNIAKYGRNEQMVRMAQLLDETDRQVSLEIGTTIQRLHKRKLQELMQQREQANYLKVEIVTGEKELIENAKGLPPKRVVDVETSVASGYQFWPFKGEYWDDELGAFVYTTESACIN